LNNKLFSFFINKIINIYKETKNRKVILIFSLHSEINTELLDIFDY